MRNRILYQLYIFSMKIEILGLVLLLLSISCNKKEKTAEKIAAKVDNEEIKLSETDNYVRYEIFEALQRIYILRKAATDELINDKLFELEARKLKVPKEKFLEEQVDNKITDFSVNKYILDHKLDSMGMPDISNGYKVFFPSTIEGRLLVREAYKKQLINDLLVNLKSKYRIEISLTPPEAPKFQISDIPIIHYRGSPNSKVNLLLISDFTCENCKANYEELEKIFKKYDNKVRFAFTHFSPNVSLASICSEAAGLQDKFWQFYAQVFTAKNFSDIDENKFIDLAKGINLDIEKFKKDISSNSLKQLVAKNIDILKAKRIYATPTFVLNGKVILEVHNITELEKMLDAAIEKQ